MTRKSLLLLAFLATVSLPGIAEESAAAPLHIVKFDDADAKSSTGSQSRVSIEAGDADAKATARIANAFTIKSGYYGRFAFTVTAPFDSKKADKVDIGTLSGLTAGTNASLDFSFLNWDMPTETARITELCKKLIPKLIRGYNWEQVGLLVPELNCNRDLLDVKKLGEAVKKINAQVESCSLCMTPPGEQQSICESLDHARSLSCSGADPDKTASRNGLCALVRAEGHDRCASCAGWSNQQTELCKEVRGKAELADDAAAIVKDATNEINGAMKDILTPMSGFTASIKANKQDFKYITTEAPTVSNESTEKGFGVSLAWTYVGATSLWSLGYSHETSYKGKDKVDVCSPIGTTGSLQCAEASIGAPEKEKAELAFIENRRMFVTGRFAIAPRVEYDLEKSKLAGRIPIYLVTNKEGALTGGLAVGYSEAAKKGKWGLTIFVSKAFSFFD